MTNQTSNYFVVGATQERPMQNEQPESKERGPRGLYCPKSFKGAAREAWKALIPVLVARDPSLVDDYHILEQLCLAWQEIKLAEENLQKTGYVMTMETKTGSSYSQQSPWCAIRDKAFDRFLKLSDRLGMSPAARKKISLEKALEDPRDIINNFLS